METLQQVEAIPAAYPTSGHDALWQRIESYCAHRWTARSVTWRVQGPGQWAPPLFPATLTGVDVWTGTEWVEAFPAPSPLGGYVFESVGPYQITATVGADNTAPAAVVEAFERLRDYLAAPNPVPGAGRYRRQIGDVSISYDRSAHWQAHALDKSGAADLLRPYRRA